MKISTLNMVIVLNFCLGEIFCQKVNPLNGSNLIRNMHVRYQPDKWYRHFTFSQRTEFYKDGNKIKEEIWHEAYKGPGQLAIKFHHQDSTNGVVFSNNMTYVISKGKTIKSYPRVHELMLAAYDVYFLDPDLTCHYLDSLGFNLNALHSDRIQGREAWVIGAVNGDTLSPQLWIDKKDLVLRKLIYRSGKSIHTVVLEDYRFIEKKKVATSIMFYEDATLIMRETYFNIRFPENLPKDLFDPQEFGKSTW